MPPIHPNLSSYILGRSSAPSEDRSADNVVLERTNRSAISLSETHARPFGVLPLWSIPCNRNRSSEVELAAIQRLCCCDAPAGPVEHNGSHDERRRNTNVETLNHTNDNVIANVGLLDRHVTSIYGNLDFCRMTQGLSSLNLQNVGSVNTVNKTERKKKSGRDLTPAERRFLGRCFHPYNATLRIGGLHAPPLVVNAATSPVETTRPRGPPSTVQHRPANPTELDLFDVVITHADLPMELQAPSMSAQDHKQSMTRAMDVGLEVPRNLFGQRDKTILDRKHTHRRVSSQRPPRSTGDSTSKPVTPLPSKPQAGASVLSGSDSLVSSAPIDRPAQSSESPSNDSDESFTRSRGVSPESRIPTPVPPDSGPAPDAILSEAGVFLPASGETLAPVPAGVSTHPDDDPFNPILPTLNETIRPLFNARNIPALISSSHNAKEVTVDLRPLLGTRLLTPTTSVYILIMCKGNSYRLSVRLCDAVVRSGPARLYRIPAVFAPFGEQDIKAYIKLLHRSGLAGVASSDLKVGQGMRTQSHEFSLDRGREFRVAVHFPKDKPLKVGIGWVNMDNLESWRSHVEI